MQMDTDAPDQARRVRAVGSRCRQLTPATGILPPVPSERPVDAAIVPVPEPHFSLSSLLTLPQAAALLPPAPEMLSGSTWLPARASGGTHFCPARLPESPFGQHTTQPHFRLGVGRL